MARFTAASDVLDFPVEERIAQSAPAARKPAEFPNKFGAKCLDCGVWVEAGEGRTRKGSTGKWEVRHVAPCPTESESDAAPARPTGWNVPDGRYTVVFPNGDYKTLRTQTQSEFDDFMPGVVLVKFLSGSDNDHDYTSFGHVLPNGSVRIWKKHQANADLRRAVDVLVGDPKAASQAYAQQSDSCSACGRTLTVPASLNAGLGPECAKKVQW